MTPQYAAGLFDGEGWIRIDKWKHHSLNHTRYCLHLGINMCDPEAIFQLFKQFGGHFDPSGRRVKPTHRTLFEWHLTTKKAYQFLLYIEPYAIVKRAQIRLAIRFQKHVWGSKRIVVHEQGGCRLPPKTIEFRERVYLKMRALKHVRYPESYGGPS